MGGGFSGWLLDRAVHRKDSAAVSAGQPDRVAQAVLVGGFGGGGFGGGGPAGPGGPGLQQGGPDGSGPGPQGMRGGGFGGGGQAGPASQQGGPGGSGPGPQGMRGGGGPGSPGVRSRWPRTRIWWRWLWRSKRRSAASAP